MPQQHTFQPPTGTRDLYPVEAARRRYITEAWRRVAVNHGFEEIDGPTFEHLDLYTVKSGEGIVSELFSFRREGGEKDYALRPEFTPTLARMYAAKAASLPKPTKWFSVGPYFRAERPQRGRLREFLQWNCDVLGFPGEGSTESELADARREADADVIACAAEFLFSLGLTHSDFKIRVNDRRALVSILNAHGVAEQKHQAVFAFLDRIPKLSADEASRQAEALEVPGVIQVWFLQSFSGDVVEHNAETLALFGQWERELLPLRNAVIERLGPASAEGNFVQLDVKIVRGLAYYTGMVFEISVDDERAIAGGGRYDNLIELFGGPPTPAVGFGMGDVVLSLVLQDKGLMPSDAKLMGLAGQSPDVFVISSGDAQAEAQVPRVLASLRRATPRAATTHPAPGTQHSLLPGLHARRSYKTTKNVGKLLQEAAKLNARFAVIIESASAAKIKDMATGAQDERTFPLDELPGELHRRLGRA